MPLILSLCPSSICWMCIPNYYCNFRSTIAFALAASDEFNGGRPKTVGDTLYIYIYIPTIVPPIISQTRQLQSVQHTFVHTVASSSMCVVCVFGRLFWRVSIPATSRFRSLVWKWCYRSLFLCVSLLTNRIKLGCSISSHIKIVLSRASQCVWNKVHMA